MMQRRGTFLRMIGQQPGERGRRLKYDPAFGQRCRDLAQNGDFPEAWCAELGVGVSTMREWIETYPEFWEDIEIACLLLTTHWTRRIAAAVESPTAKPGLYAMIARRFPALYGTNPVDLMASLTGAQGGQSPTQTTGDASTLSGGAPMGSSGHPATMPTADIEKKLAALRARRAAEGDGK